MKRIILMGTFAAVLLCFSIPHATIAEDTLPPDLTKQVIDADIAMLQKEIAKADRVKLFALKGTAMMIALYAQDHMSGPDAAKMAALRDQALKVADAITKKDKAATLAAVEGLTKLSGGSKEKVDVSKQHEFTIGEAMSPFKRAPRGQNLESDMKKQTKKLTDVKLVGEIGVRTAIYGRLTLELMPEDAAKPGSADAKLWETTSKDMIRLGRKIAVEAARGDKADHASLQTRLKALDAACDACHEKFK